MITLVVTVVTMTLYCTQGRHLIEESCPKRHYLDISLKGDKVCRQCSDCKPGYNLLAHCTKVRDTHCEPCRPGTYASNNAKRCRPCKHCRRRSKQARNCRNIDRAQCRCPKGTYYTEGTCKPCTKCLPGSYVKSSCTHARDTRCNGCPRGTFSKLRNLFFCRKCSECRPGEVLVQMCNSTSDTVCGECRPGMFRLKSTGECATCSPCYPDIDGNFSSVIIIEECRKRNPDQSRICMPAVTRSLAYVSNATGVGSTTGIPGDSAVEPPAHVKMFEGDPESLVLFIITCTVITLVCLALISLCFAHIHRNIGACEDCIVLRQKCDSQHMHRNLLNDYLTEQRSSTSDRIIRSNSALVQVTKTNLKQAGTALSLETGLMHYFTEDEFHPPVRWNIGKRGSTGTSYSDILSVSATGTLSSSKGAENKT
ncbi:uncharacterized protein LOC117328957 [Pecten maximus]|uniref:uncharacterized protein LOC117328957 n=1 Tax=Pecten maximus TaxID=6579 RepID=UPI001458E2DC|nr:uncharacterized protein LOC117328957 [Pecten maximus]XP_033742483.1 uncharacterized protein LOC117328957 [Pecten maximus]